MAAKTYVPELRVVGKDFVDYGTRWFIKLDITLDDAAMDKLQAAIDAVNALLIELGPQPYNP